MPAINSEGTVDGASPLSSTETLLRNIQSLLKVAADNARQQERQISYEKGEWINSCLSGGEEEEEEEMLHYRRGSFQLEWISKAVGW